MWKTCLHHCLYIISQMLFWIFSFPLQSCKSGNPLQLIHHSFYSGLILLLGTAWISAKGVCSAFSGVWPKKMLIDPGLKYMAMQHLRGVLVMPVNGRIPKAFGFSFSHPFPWSKVSGLFSYSRLWYFLCVK